MNTASLLDLARRSGSMPINPNPKCAYLQCRKIPGGGYRMFARGTANEVFPGEVFRSPSEARATWEAVVSQYYANSLPR